MREKQRQKSLCFFHIQQKGNISLNRSSSETKEAASMELNQTSICYYDKRLAGISSCTESSDSIVPDTFPDIGRVICA